MNTLKRFALSCALLCALALSASAQSASDITVSGILYNAFNDPCTSCTFTVTVTRRDDVAVQSAPKTVTSHASTGAISFTLPRKSLVTFLGNFTVGRYSWKAGISMFVPDQATADIVDLQSVDDAVAALVSTTTGAPTTADYIVGTANGALSAEQSLGALTTGLLKNTVSGSTGTLSTAVAADLPLISTLTADASPDGAADYVLTYDASAGAHKKVLLNNLPGGGGGGGGGSGTVNSGTANQLAYYASTGTAVSGLTSANSSVLVTDGSGVPSWATSLPSGTTINSVAIVTTTGTQTVTDKTISGSSNTLSNIGNSSLTNSAITIAGTSTSLGGSITLDTITGLSSTGLIKRTGANTMAIATGGTDYESPLTFSTGLTRSTNTITVNTSQNIATLSNLTSNGFVTTSGGAGTLGVTVPGSGVLTALAVNTGSAGAFVVNGGALGTPSSGTLTNATGLPLSTGVSGLGTGIATALAVNVGSAGAPVLFNGAGGTPSSLTLTNATGLPPVTGISGWPANSSGVLTNNGSGTLTWAAAGGGITVGTTTITSGTSGRLGYNNAGVYGEISGLSTNGSTTITQTSNSATAFESGPNGGTNPVFRLVNNTSSQATGLSITGNAAGNGVDLQVLSSGTNEGINIRTKAAASIRFWANSTNVVSISSSEFTSEFVPIYAIGYRVANGYQVNFSNGSDYSRGFGSGTGSNAVRVTNGGNGAGSLVLGTSTVGSIGTSGVGVLAIANGTAPTSSPADTAQVYTADINATAGNAGFHIRNEINTAALILPGVRYKTDTGDPTDVYEGMMVINTFDNTFKVYAEGAWRTITTW